MKNLIARADAEKGKGSLKDAAHLYEEAFIMCQEQEDDNMQFVMELANKTAMAFLATGEIRRSIDYFNEALSIGKEIEDVVSHSMLICCDLCFVRAQAPATTTIRR